MSNIISKNENQIRKSLKSKTLPNIQIYELKLYDFNICFREDASFDESTKEIELAQQRQLLDIIEVYISKCDEFINKRAPNLVNVFDY